MAEEKTEKLYKYLNLNPEEDWDVQKKQIDEKFVSLDGIEDRSDVVEPVMGKANGLIKTKIAKVARELDIEVSNEEMEDKKTTEIVEMFGTKLSEKLGGYAEEKEKYEQKLKEATKDGASKKQLQELEEQANAFKQKYEETSGLLKDVQTEYEGYKGTVEQEKQKSFMDKYKSEAYGKVKLKANSDYERKGFFSEIESKYKLDRDGDEVIVRNSEGERVKNPDKAGSFLTYTDVVQKEADAAGLLDKNPHSDKTVRKPHVPNPVVPTNGQEAPKRRVNTGATAE